MAEVSGQMTEFGYFQIDRHLQPFIFNKLPGG
jgi:hypothetical protein